MGIPVFLVITLIISALLAIFSNYASERNKKKIKTFLDEQSKVYIVSKDKLNDINFLDIDLSSIRFKAKSENTKLEINKLLQFETLKMTNFNNTSNEELKKIYGSNNFDEVLTYQNNYDDFLKQLITTAEFLINDGDLVNAEKLLNLSISLGNDVTKNYTLLADIYESSNMRKDLYKLIDYVKSNKNLSQNKIMSYIYNIQSKKLKGE